MYPGTGGTRRNPGSAGYTRSAGKCVACASGLVKEGAGDAACNTCTGNTFSRAGALQCSPCPLSAVMQENHTSCSCNTAFVFFKDTCTPTEEVYLNVSGVLQLPLGKYRDWKLKQILVDGFSAYLNVSKGFITATVLQDDEVADDTGENVSAGNSSYLRRRLLYDRPVQFWICAAFGFAGMFSSVPETWIGRGIICTQTPATLMYPETHQKSVARSVPGNEDVSAGQVVQPSGPVKSL